MPARTTRITRGGDGAAAEQPARKVQAPSRPATTSRAPRPPISTAGNHAPSSDPDQVETARRATTATTTSARRTVANRATATTATAKSPSASTSRPPSLTSDDVVAQIRDVNLIKRETVSSLRSLLSTSAPDSLTLARKTLQASLVSYRALHAAGWKVSNSSAQDVEKRTRVAYLVEASLLAVKRVASERDARSDQVAADIIRVIKGIVAVGMHAGLLLQLSTVKAYLLDHDDGGEDGSEEDVRENGKVRTTTPCSIEQHSPSTSTSASVSTSTPPDELCTASRLLSHSIPPSPLPSTSTVHLATDIQIITLTVLADGSQKTPPSLAGCRQLAAALTHPHSGCIAWMQRASERSDDDACQRAASRIGLQIERCTARVCSLITDPAVHFDLRSAAVVAMLRSAECQQAANVAAARDAAAPAADGRRKAILDRLQRIVQVYYNESADDEKRAAFQRIHAYLARDVQPIVEALQWAQSDEWMAVLRRCKAYAVRVGDDIAARRLRGVIEGEGRVGGGELGRVGGGDSPNDSEAAGVSVGSVATTSSTHPPPLLPALRAAEDELLMRYNKRRGGGGGGNDDDDEVGPPSVDEDAVLQGARAALAATAATITPPADALPILHNLMCLCAHAIADWCRLEDGARRTLRIDFHRAVLRMALSSNAALLALAVNGYCLLSQHVSQTTPEASPARLQPLEMMQECHDALQRHASHTAENDPSTLHSLTSSIVEQIWSDGAASYKAQSWTTAARILAASASMAQQHLPVGYHSAVERKPTWEKWLAVAGCRGKLSRPRDLLAAYASAMQCVPVGVWSELEKGAAIHSDVEAVFDVAANSSSSSSSSSLAKIAMALRFAAQLSIKDLLIDQRGGGDGDDGDDGDDHHHPHPLSILAILHPLPSEARALALEYICTQQAHSGPASQMHIPAVRTAVEAFLRRSVDLTDATAMPVRKARRYLRVMELMALRGRGGGGGGGGEDEEWAEYAEQAEDALQRVGGGHAAQDVGIQQERGRLQVELRLWGVIADDGEGLAAVSRACRLASDALRPFVAVSEAEAGTSAAAAVAAASKPPLQVRSANSSTPPRRRAARGGDAAAAAGASSKSVPARKQPMGMAVDTSPSSTPTLPTTTLSLLEHVCNYLVAAGHTLPAIELLLCLRAASAAADASSDVHARSTGSLALQYLTLNRPVCANAILAPLVETSASACRVSPACRFTLLVAHVQVLCALDQPSKAATAYEEAVDIAESLHADLIASAKTVSGMTTALGKVSHHVRAYEAASAYSRLALANGDLVQSLRAAYLAIREASTAAEGVCKIVAASTQADHDKAANTAGDDVFDAAPPSAAPSDAAQETAKDVKMQTVVVSGPPAKVASPPVTNLLSLTVANLHWRSVHAYTTSHLHASSLLERQGSASDSLAQLSQVLIFATRLSLPVVTADILLCRAQLQFRMHDDEEAKQDVEHVKRILASAGVPSPQEARLRVVRAQYLASRPQPELKQRALVVYDTVLEAVRDIDSALRAIQGRATDRAGDEQASDRIVKTSASTARTASGRTAKAPSVVDGTATRRAPMRGKSSTAAAAPAKGKTQPKAATVKATQPRTSSGSATSPLSPAPRAVLGDILLDVLSAKAELLAELDQPSESHEVIAEAITASRSTSSLAQLTHAKLALRQALKDMSGDPLWGLVSDAVLSLPIGGSSTSLVKTLATCAKTVLTALSTAEAGYRLAASGKSVPANPLRRALVGLANTIVLQSMATSRPRSAAMTTKLVQSAQAYLDHAACVTLQRQYAQAIWSKFEDDAVVKTTTNATRFIRLTATHGYDGAAESTLPAALQKLQIGQGPDRALRRRSPSPTSMSSDSDEEDEEDENQGNAEPQTILERFWQAKQRECQVEGDVTSESVGSHPELPAGWTVVALTLSPDKSSLLLSRQSAKGASRVLSLPIGRRSDDDEEEEELEGSGDEDGENVDAGVLTMEKATSRLRDIVVASNQLSSDAAGISQSADATVKGREWWQHRRELDDRLRRLCQDIETKWLGPFKGVFDCCDDVDDDGGAGNDLMASGPMKAFKKTIGDILQKACLSSVGTPQRRGSKASSSADSRISSSDVASAAAGHGKVKLDDGMFAMIAGLHKVAVSDEELEDLLTYLMELYQFNGVPVALDEVDLDVLVVDMRSALDELRAGLYKAGLTDASNDAGKHLFLVLDKDTCSFPWESTPCLRGKAVCRIPSLEFLHDRVKMARGLGATLDVNDGAFHLSANPSAFYLVNPSGDLHKTQERFTPYLTQSRQPTWRGIMGHEPVADEFVDALQGDDLVMYFGHGGASRHARPRRVRALQKCAVTMLWGCSSAMLSPQGDFDPTGTPYTYMCAGSPCLVGQLFDATDKELDSVAESVLIKAGLKDGGSASQTLLSARHASSNRDDVEGKFVDGGKLVPDASQRRMSLARAVAQSRDSCRLPYLTGAATVVWGVPVYFDR